MIVERISSDAPKAGQNWQKWPVGAFKVFCILKYELAMPPTKQMHFDGLKGEKYKWQIKFRLLSSARKNINL